MVESIETLLNFYIYLEFVTSKYLLTHFIDLTTYDQKYAYDGQKCMFKIDCFQMINI